MRATVLLWQVFLKEAFTRWELLLPFVVNQLLALWVFSWGFQRVAGAEYAQVLVIGWIGFAMVTIGVISSITLTIDLSLQKIRYWLSLPVAPGAIVLGKLLSASILCVAASLFTLGLGQLFLLRLNPSQTLWVLAALILQGFTLVGFLASISIFIRDITKIGVIVSLIIGILQYLSVVYFPIEVFPTPVRAVIYLNPLTYAITFIRALVLSGQFDWISLAVLAGLSVAWLGVGWGVLQRKALHHER
ncbi:MAG: ABC transporter permease [Candidatus Bipolaricaulota bacterium]|nr:ABC transporter permease [Candidatus Bipolaricaulota bacterium]MDW8031197.1 ABC transporter permease [Candidatus Bipolaricaulota bacterium]